MKIEEQKKENKEQIKKRKWEKDQDRGGNRALVRSRFTYTKWWAPRAWIMRTIQMKNSIHALKLIIPNKIMDNYKKIDIKRWKQRPWQWFDMGV